MKKSFVLIAIALLLTMLMALALPACDPVPDDPINPDLPARGAANIGSKWVSGNLVFYDKSSGNTMMTLDGTNEDVEITTLTTPTVSGTTTINDLVSANATLTAPSISGTTAINDLTSSNATFASPTITGTSVVSNRASGASGNFTAGSGAGVIVTHGMSGTPTRIWLNYDAAPGGTPPAIYATSINGTAFTISLSANITNSVKVYWLAYILDE